MAENVWESARIGLTAKDKKVLLDTVRSAIENHWDGRDTLGRQDISEILKKNRGAFVTLYKLGHLRGCIGQIEARRPLHQTIQEMAVAAAFHDPRFPPVQREEWSRISFEISVLSPLKEIQNVQEIEVGCHGIYLMRGACCGLLLPQVATEYGWDRETFLQQTCCKAGLPMHAWKDKETRIFIFSADIFGSEEELAPDIKP